MTLTSYAILAPHQAGPPAVSAAGASVIVLPPEIDVTNSPAIAAELNGLTRERLVIADLTGTEFCDCSGARALPHATRHARHLGHGLRLAVPPGGQVARLLDLVGFTPHLHVYPSVRATVAGLC